MTEAPNNSSSHESPDALARLRDRTDEIELIVSGLTTVALFTLPGWLFESLASVHTHNSAIAALSSEIVLKLVSGLFYGLGFCFVVHLLSRAYWASLIGLRTVFPDGIDWSRTPGIGPVTRDWYRSHLPSLREAIERSDRFASSLFAVISLVAVSVLWVGTVVLVMVFMVGAIGARFDLSERGITRAALITVALLPGTSLLLWLLDAVVARRLPGVRRLPGFEGLVRLLVRFQATVVPQRLLLPVQLTLQSNTRPLAFIIVLIIGGALLGVAGSARYKAWTQFTLSDEFRHLTDEDTRGGFRSGHYEEMRGSRDRFRPWPMIDRFEQQGSYVRLFLPYQPLRDNPVLDRLCPSTGPARGPDCLRMIWSVTINDSDVPTAPFLPTERLDLNMRGLTAWVPLESLPPGLHKLNVVWNPMAEPSDATPAAGHQPGSNRFSIPFLFNPAYERALQEGAGSGRP